MRTLILLVAISALCGCRSTNQTMRYAPADGPFSPVIVSHGSEQRCNRIGVIKDAHVDPNSPGIYHQQQMFRTAKGEYRNDIYRVHFERIPLGHLSWGRNVGIFVIVTSDSEERPLLVTTLHTCGCYSAVVPTSQLDKSMLPENWGAEPQVIYNERLPRVLELPSDWQNWHPEIQLRPGSHRVMDIRSIVSDEAPLRTLPMNAIIKEGFYHDKGPLKGYVKGSNKPFEQLLMWWTLDPCIGSDKRLGPHEKVGAQLYTSIRFWMRDESDIWNFGNWLTQEGWRL